MISVLSRRHRHTDTPMRHSIWQHPEGNTMHKGWRKPSIPMIICFTLLAIVIMELFVFNAAHWRTRSLTPVAHGNITIGQGLSETDQKGVYRVSDASDSYVQTSLEHPATLYSVRVAPAKAYTERTAAGSPQSIHATLMLKQNGVWHNATRTDTWVDLSKVLEFTQSQKTQYLLLNNSDVSALRIMFTDTNHAVSFGSVEVNTTVPLRISLTRILVMLALAAFLLLFRPRSTLYSMRLKFTSHAQLIAFGLLAIVNIAMVAWIVKLNGPAFFANYSSERRHWSDPNQYGYLADALIHGHTWLNLPVADWLTTMPNPYDYHARQAMVDAHGGQIFWDYAYFRGHYYTYFGVIPAIVAFVPWRLLTGQMLSSYGATAFFAALFILAAVYLIPKLAHRYFPHASFGLVFLITMVFIVGSNTFYFSYNPNFYGIPIMAALAFVTGGLGFWLAARRDNGSLSWWRLALGSFLIALTIGTRPQFIVAALLAFPLFWKEIVHSRQLFSRAGWKETLAALAPFVAVGIPIAGYNYIRFGSFLDFGSNYNLTSFDMTSQRPSPFLVPVMMFLQLFQPPVINPIFPFFSATENRVCMPHEPSLGGVFFIVPFLLFTFLIFFLYKRLRKWNLWGLSLILFCLPWLVSVADVSIAGVNNRYLGDSTWMWLLCAVLICLSLENFYQDQSNEMLSPLDIERHSTMWRVFISITEILVLGTLIITFAGLFARGRAWEMSINQPDLYLSVKSWFLGLS